VAYDGVFENNVINNVIKFGKKFIKHSAKRISQKSVWTNAIE